MLNEFQNRELELESEARMKTVPCISKETTSLSSQPHIRSFLMIRNMEVQDKADIRTCVD